MLMAAAYDLLLTLAQMVACACMQREGEQQLTCCYRSSWGVDIHGDVLLAY